MASTTLPPFSYYYFKSVDVATLDKTIAEILKKMPTTSGTGLSSTDSDELQALLTKIHGAVQRERDLEKQINYFPPSSLWKLKAVVNDLNDLMEELSADASSHVRTSSILKPNFIGNRQNVITPKIKVLIKDLGGVAKDMTPEDDANKGTNPAITKDGQEMHELEVVGRENEKKHIIYELNLLGNKENGEATVPVHVPVPVVIIVGVAGIGKTELARLVCEDEEVKARFGHRIWIDVKFDVESIAEQVLHSIVTDGEGYLIVLDDVRIEIGDQNLMELQQKLEGPGGAILITTRSNFVANKIATSIRSNFIANEIAASPDTAKPYVLQGLNKEESWSLFQQICGQGSISSDFKRVIVTYCGGVPQRVITAASLFKNQVRPLDWEFEVVKLMGKALKLNYYDALPMDQMLCFTYCSLFPKNHLFDAEKLIHLWMAEGFVNVRSGTNSSVKPEEICRWYLSNFPEIQDVKQDECGVLKSFRMHPLFHDLACLVTDDEENITGNITVDPNARRALFHCRLDIRFEIPDSLFEKAKKLRSILFPSETQSKFSQELKVSVSTCDKIFKTFKRLQMLDLYDLGIKTVPKSIGELKELRYLDLSNNNIEKLPGSITKLCKLQTLKLSQCHHLKELPKNIEDLISLRHLVIEGCYRLTAMPRKINKLSSLQTLSLFVVSKQSCNKGGLGVLACLKNLRGHLQIWHLERLKFRSPIKKYLKKIEHLQQLTLTWNLGDEKDQEYSLDCLKPHPNLQVLVIGGYKGLALPHWLPSIRCLVKLSLYNSGCKSLGQPHQLPNLKILELLRLDNLEYIEENYNESVVFFPFLEELTISYCPKLQRWWNNEALVEGPSFACISKLHIHYSPNLLCMPLCPLIDKELVLVNSNLHPLFVTKGSETDKENIIPFSKLKIMQIACDDISYQLNTASFWSNFVSLESLHIRECSSLWYLPESFWHLSSLQQLIIENCPELNFNLSSPKWEGLKKLRSLKIREIPMLDSLPSGVGKVITLQELELHNCTELKSLPESIGNLTSLENLVISECRKLASLPKGMAKLKDLRTLIILDCDLLLPRCYPEIGDDWPQIAHVGKDNIQVKRTYQDN